MMDLDEELTLRIKTVFDNYDDGESDMGWTQLRSKYPKESTKKFPLYWFIGAAASLLIILGLWFLKNPTQDQEKPQVTVGKKQKPIIENDAVKQENTATTKVENKSSDTNLATIGKENLNQSISAVQKNVVTNKKTTEQKNSAPINVMIAQQNPIINSKTEPIKTDPMNSNSIAQVNPITKNIDTLKIEKNNQQIAKNEVKAAVVPPVQQKTTEEFLRDQSKLSTKIEQKEKREKGGQNTYEVFTGTFLNYYANNDVKVNAGFGLNASLKVANGVFLSVGAGISQNKISYQNYVPDSKSDKLYADYATVSGSTTMLQNGGVSNVKLNAQLLSLDLPIMVKFYPSKKQNFYISTGFNSNSYFAQKYDFTYTMTYSSAFQKTAQTDREETERKKFAGFDFANSAIFAIGLSQKIGKNNNLIFEPYFKPAIGSMGDKNLKINTVGLNLKFSLSNAGKK